MTYFKRMSKMNTFQWNYRFQGFSKDSLLPFVVFVWNITKMTEMEQISVKSADLKK